MKRLQQCLVITGMHRSNTSLAAKAFHQIGLSMGSDLMPPSKHNQEGYFEDKQIIALHDQWLRNRGYDFWDLRKVDTRTLAFLPGEETTAKQLLENVFPNQSIIGIKDPRATLFLPLWAKLSPDTRFVLVFRHPQKTIRSLVNRRDFWKDSYFRLRQAVIALKVWETYNRYLLNFAQANPQRCLLLEAPADINTASSEYFDQVFRELWQWDLPSIDFEKAINPKLLQSSKGNEYGWLLRFYPQALALYEALQQLNQTIRKTYENSDIRS